MSDRAIAAAALAPTGRLRAAINFGNAVLAQKSAEGTPGGVSVALAHAVGRELALPVDLVPFDQAGPVFEAGKRDRWDIAFLAIDPVRAAELDFTAPYVVIEGTYAVATNAMLHSVDEVDQPGRLVAITRGSAYDLHLTRALKHATLLRSDLASDALAMLIRGQAEALAGVRQNLLAYAAAHPAIRLLPGRFMQIDQAMALPKGRPAGADYLRHFVEQMKSSGFVARELAASGQGDATVAPPALPT